MPDPLFVQQLAQQLPSLVENLEATAVAFHDCLEEVNRAGYTDPRLSAVTLSLGFSVILMLADLEPDALMDVSERYYRLAEHLEGLAQEQRPVMTEKVSRLATAWDIHGLPETDLFRLLEWKASQASVMVDMLEHLLDLWQSGADESGWEEAFQAARVMVDKYRRTEKEAG